MSVYREGVRTPESRHSCCHAPAETMHPVLRLWEDFLTDRGVLSLPALPRMLYVVRGAASELRSTLSLELTSQG